MNIPAAFQSRTQRILALTALAGILGMFIGAFTRPESLARSYWFAWLYFSGISFGSFALLGMHHLTVGKWSTAARRPAEAAVRVLPLAFLLMIPALIWMPHIFPWATAIGAQTFHGATHGAAHKAAYLAPKWFIIRSVLYFVLITGFAYLLTRRAAYGPAPMAGGTSLATFSGPGLVVHVLCMNFAAADWIMSLQPQWYSTMMAVILLVSQFLSALAVATIAVTTLPLPGSLEPSKVYHDSGNLLLAFVVFWTYVTFSQFLIIWSGNLPAEISWYVVRRGGGWQYIAIALAVCHFAFPFALLLSRKNKRNPWKLRAVACWILATSLVNFFWLVIPALRPGPFRVDWLDVAAVLGIGSLWTLLFLNNLHRARPDPDAAHNVA